MEREEKSKTAVEDIEAAYTAYSVYVPCHYNPAYALKELLKFHEKYFGQEYRARFPFLIRYFAEHIEFFLPVIPIDRLRRFPIQYTLLKRRRYNGSYDSISKKDAILIANVLSDWFLEMMGKEPNNPVLSPTLLGKRSDHRLSPFITIHDIDGMSGEDFERFLKRLFEQVGYRVIQTQRSKDQGADLILSVDESKIVVQAKRYSGNVGNSAIQEVTAAKGLYSANRGIVVCNRSFTREAMVLAAANSIDLIDREKLIEMLSLYKLRRA
jgi:HJR/Mrr/RecB family endonuclease